MLWVLIGVLMVYGRTPAMADNSWAIVTPGLVGTAYKMQVTLGLPATDAYIRSDRPRHAEHYRASFWIDVAGLNMPEGSSSLRFLRLVDDSEGGIDPYTGEIAIGFLKNSASDHAWHFVVWARNDAGQYSEAANVVLGSTSGFPVQVELEFWGGAVGDTTLCARKVSGTPAQSCSAGVSMQNADVDSLILGAFTSGNPGNHTGTFSIDELESDF